MTTGGATHRQRALEVAKAGADTNGRRRQGLSGMRRLAFIGSVLALIVGLCLGGAAGGAAVTPRHGGSLTVLETQAESTWTSLDPATDPTCCDFPMKVAIFGELFELEKSSSGSPVMVPDLATGYKFQDHNKTIVLDIRRGVEFSDGTPFDASAVAYNWNRDLNTTCSCRQEFLQKTKPVIRVLSKYRLSITLTYPDASFIDALQDAQFDYIGSPTAERHMSEQAFAKEPVGAGPFVVAADDPGSSLVLRRNPRYWQKGLPYLKNLTFKLVSGDEAALEALNAGSANVYENMVTPSLVPQFKSRYQVTVEPAESEMAVQFNTRVPPFNKLKAREAVLYATNAALLDQKLNDNLTPLTESFIEKGGLFFKSAKIPGYIHYDLAKAKALVKSLGGLQFNVITQALSSLETLQDGLIAEWAQAGIKATANVEPFLALQGSYASKKWQAAVHYVGSLDPAVVLGPSLMFGPLDAGNYSGVEDPQLNSILNRAAETVSPGARKHLYYEASKIIAKKAYGIFLYPVFTAQIAAKGIGGPGLTTAIPAAVSWPSVLWQYAYNNG